MSRPRPGGVPAGRGAAAPAAGGGGRCAGRGAWRASWRPCPDSTGIRSPSCGTRPGPLSDAPAVVTDRRYVRAAKEPGDIPAGSLCADGLVRHRIRPLHSARWGDGSCRPGRPCGGPGPSACRAAPHPAAGHGSLPAASTCAPGEPFDGPRRPMPRSPVWSVRVALRCGCRTLVDAASRTRCSVPGRPKRPSCGRGSPHPRERGALRASRQAESGHPDVRERPGGRADQRIRLAGDRDPAPCGGVPRPLQRHARVRQMEHGCPGAALFDHGSPAWLTDLAPPVGPGHDRIRDAPGHRADRPTIRLSHRIAPELTTHHWGHRAPKEMRRR